MFVISSHNEKFVWSNIWINLHSPHLPAVLNPGLDVNFATSTIFTANCWFVSLWMHRRTMEKGPLRKKGRKGWWVAGRRKLLKMTDRMNLITIHIRGGANGKKSWNLLPNSLKLSSFKCSTSLSAATSQEKVIKKFLQRRRSGAQLRYRPDQTRVHYTLCNRINSPIWMWCGRKTICQLPNSASAAVQTTTAESSASDCFVDTLKVHLGYSYSTNYSNDGEFREFEIGRRDNIIRKIIKWTDGPS